MALQIIPTYIQQIKLGLQGDRPPLPPPLLIWMEQSFILGLVCLLAYKKTPTEFCGFSTPCF